MDTVSRRKQTSTSGHDYDGNDNRDTTGMHHNVSSVSNHMSSKEPQFHYGGLILRGLSVPFIVALLFGGRPALIALCFGSVIAYIFDILGTLEATMVTLTISLMATWGTLVFASRNLLQESVLNIFMILLLAILLILIFVTIASQFRGLRLEMDSIFFFMEPVIFSNISLICSAIITWFLCVELPSVDLSICFSSIYFIYLLIFAKPRLPSSWTPSPIKDDERPIFIINQSVLQILYVTPILISFILHIALHHNVLETSWDRLIGMIISILYPTLLMIMCAELQVEYWAYKDQSIVSYLLSIGKLISALGLILSIQTHPILDDIKIFSGLKEPLASYTISGSIFLLFAAIYSYRQRIRDKTHLPSVGTIHGRRNIHFIENPIVTICIALSSLLFGLLIGLKWYTLPISIIGSVSLAELYQVEWDFIQNQSSKSTVFIIILLALSAIGIQQSGFDIAHKTLWHLTYIFKWHIQINMSLFCIITICLSVTAVILPCLAMLVGAGNSAGESRDGKGTGSQLFGVGYLVFAAVTACGELLVREQDWKDVGTTTETVYPSYLVAGVTLLFIITTAHLTSIGIIRFETTTALIIIQSCKLLPLLGIPSMTAGSLASLLMSFTLPFALYFSRLQQAHQQNADSAHNSRVNRDDFHVDAYHRTNVKTYTSDSDSSDASSMPVIYSLFFTASAAFNAFWGYSHTFPFFLSLLLDNQHPPSPLQNAAAASGSFFCFMAIYINFFWRQLSAIRSVLLLLTLICTLLATEALGPLAVTLDRSSPTYVVLSLHPELSSDQTGLFLLVSALLVFLSSANIFPIRKPIPRLTFILLFSFCSAKALLGWSFAKLTGSHGHIQTIGYFSFPWVYCLVTTVLSTSTALHAALPQSKSSASWMFSLTGSVPILAVVWSVLANSFLNYGPGILWVAVTSHGAIALSTKANELIREYMPQPLSNRQKVDKPTASAHSQSMISMAAICGLFWMALATIFTPHTTVDLTVPAYSLLFLCTKTGLLIHNAHPAFVVAIVSTIWWFSHAIYSIMLKKWNPTDLAHINNKHGLFMENNVSFWSNNSFLLPLVTFLLALVPIPAIILSFLRRRNESEDLMFMLTILSAIPVIGGAIWSVRLLGILGIVYGAWRCKDLSNTKTASDRVI